jgi:hypothetical protein
MAAQCHIQWLYVAVHGCKTYLNLNLNLVPGPDLDSQSVSQSNFTSVGAQTGIR